MTQVLEILTALGIFAFLGGVIGALLAFSSKRFHVEADERIKKVSECLPGANCGGCGYAGCLTLAEKIVKGEASVNACSVGGDEAALKISEIMDVKAEKKERMRAQIMCSGDLSSVGKRAFYSGAADCRAATLMGGADKSCRFGCIGLGTCVLACPFEAISVADGVARVDYIKCRGCGACVSACPRGVIELVPYGAPSWVGCKSQAAGKETRDTCAVGCIGCGICAKNCPSGAIEIKNNLARIDPSKCTNCGVCKEKCPRKIIWSAQVCGTDGLVISKV